MQNRGTDGQSVYIFSTKHSHTKIELNSIHMQVNKLNMVEFNRSLKKTFSHMKNFSYFFTPNQWNNSTSFSLLSSHNNAIISQLNGTKKRHLWKTVCFSFKTIPFFKRSKYHDLRNLQHENQDAKKTKKYLVPSSRNQRSKKSLRLYALFIMSRFYNNSFFFVLYSYASWMV